MQMRRKRQRFFFCAALVFLGSAGQVAGFLEDLCLPREPSDGTLSWCVRPTCPPTTPPTPPHHASPDQILDFATIEPGRSMIHMDATYFIAQALGYRADVAYWIAAYNEVTDLAHYVPIDQCGVQAANQVAIDSGTTKQTAVNTGRDYIAAEFNGFQRTNLNTDGPLDHYVVPFSPNGQGTDAHGAGGVQAVYPFYYPRPGYPEHIDDVYQVTLYNLRQWAMLATEDPGLLCAGGLTVKAADGSTRCLENAKITGAVPIIQPSEAGVPINVDSGRKILNATDTTPPQITYYEMLRDWLNDPARTTGTLWLDANPRPVPVQVARMGIYLHAIQDTSSHGTFCGDDAPSPPGGRDPGTYMFMANGNAQVNLSFGSSCATSPHLASHLQETGTGANPLPLRVYTALNITLNELIEFGNRVALSQGWIVNRDLLPPNVSGGRNGRNQSAADLQATLIGTIVSGTPYTRGEVYQSGVVTRPLQETNSLDRLHAMNSALSTYSETLKGQTPQAGNFVPLVHLPGNSGDPNNTSVCWQPLTAGSSGSGAGR